MQISLILAQKESKASQSTDYYALNYWIFQCKVLFYFKIYWFWWPFCSIFRYADIDDLGACGAKFVDLPKACNGKVLDDYDGYCSVGGEPVYDIIKIPCNVTKQCSDEDGEYERVQGHCETQGQAESSPAMNPTVFAPDFLKKDSNLSKTYTNNLYDVKKNF